MCSLIDASSYHSYYTDIVVADTDSVFIKFAASDNLEEHWKLGEEAAEMAGRLFKRPHVLELEKLMHPLILARKKRYVGLQFEDITRPGKAVFKGIQVSRRDSPQVVKDTLRRAINKVLYGRDVDGAVAYIQNVAKKLLTGEIPHEDLVMSKKLADGYATDKHPHLQVVAKMRARAPGSEPRSGDRVPFLYIAPPPTGIRPKAYELAEDPLYVKQHALPLDVEYYLSNVLIKPVVSLFDLLMDNAKERIFQTGDVVIARNNVKNANKRQRGIRQFCVAIPRYISNNDFLSDDSDSSM